MNAALENKRYHQLYKIEILLAALIAVGISLEQSSAVSALFAISFIILFVFYIVYSVNEVNSILLCLILLTVINVSISGITYDKTQIGFDYFKKTIMFLTTCIYFVYASKCTKIDGKQEKFFFVIAAIVSLYFIIQFYVFGNLASYRGKYLKLNFSNPNAVAMWLLHFILYLALAIIRYKNFALRVLAVVIMAFLIDLLIKTGCRSCEIGVAFFAAMLVVYIVRRKYTMSKATLVILALIPILFLVFYLVFFVNNDFFISTFDFAVDEGKSLESRVAIWKQGVQQYKQHPLIGAYASSSGGTGQGQAHNTHLDVILSYGTVPFVLFIYLLYMVLDTINEKTASFEQYSAYCAFVAVIVMGTFEAAIVAGCTGLNFLTGGFIVLACAERKAQA